MTTEKKTPITKTSYQDQANSLAPGLFRTGKRGELNGKGMRVTYQLNENTSVLFMGVALGVPELRLLQAITALAALKETKIIELNTDDANDRQLVLLGDLTGIRPSTKSAMVCTTYNALMREAGYSSESKDVRDDMKRYLQNLAAVTCVLQGEHTEKAADTRLLLYKVDDTTGEIEISLNTRLTSAIIGNSRFTIVDMDEARALKTDPARLLHNRLSAVVDVGKSRVFSLDTLMSYVWPEPATGSTMRMRRKAIREALNNISATPNWAIDPVDEKSQVKIFRNLKRKP